jgi:glycosyltransferase involved in cell wall biosynthesis
MSGDAGGAGVETPVVTVLIDTYNHGSYIEEAIESVLAQDFAFERVEVLVVDDGSEDDTAERVRRFGARVQYFCKANGGQASAFHFGLAKARGEFVAFLDGDDYWLPGKLQRVMEEFAKHPNAGMVYHRLREFDTRNGEQEEGQFAAISGVVTESRRTLMSYILYPTSALAFRRSCLDALLPIPEGLRIQADAHLSGLVIFVAPIVAIDETLAMYRVHGRNLFRRGAAGPGDAAAVAEGAERRIATRGVLIEGMRRWLTDHGHDLADSKVRDYMMQWSLAQDEDAFAIREPGRVEFFRHLWRCSRCFAPRRSRRHVVVSYANALGALVVGYRHFDWLDEWRVRAFRPFRSAHTSAPSGRPLDRTVQ